MAIKQELNNGVLWAVIDRPEALNAFDIPDLEELRHLFRDAKTNADVRVLVLTGTGRAFSVGADIKAMDKMTEAEFGKAASLYQALAREALSLDKPIIGAINGFALGGGLEVALMCDIRIAGKSAKLGLPDAYMGFSPTGGLTWLLTRMVGLSVAMDMALSTDMLDADASLRVGLVSRVVADDQLEPVAREMAERIAAFPERGLRNIKRSFYMAADADFASVLTLEEAYDSDCFRSEGTQKALKDFIESRRK
ncbi:enoyl-CoA hydratase/isomerase family protein [Pontibaca salina]|uniref:Enoyl-CoA hydratase/isomerase family protein n=1 Tax=Pontibaca salina TaxID=2795731 RepID=A0A934M1I6_9RHOB|nr:enoyl-CoA hydratase-related protein [Pontibaca salina]MBI6630838.1 enoyl-CoA hydratase/isomerase family protein [Pontibaca salina]